MKKSIVQFITFSLPILLFVLFLEYKERSNQESVYAIKWKEYKQQKERVNTLFLGSSNSLYGFKPTLFSDSAYSLSFVSQSLDLDYQLMLKTKKEGAQLKRVILGLHPVTFGIKLEDSEEKWRMLNYRDQFDIPTPLQVFSYTIEKGFKNTFNSVFFKKKKQVKFGGWSDLYKKSGTSESLSQSSIQNFKRHQEYLNKDNMLEYLTSIIQHCKVNNIELLLVAMPLHSSYPIRDYWKKPLSTFKNEFLFLNYTDSLNQDENFYDVDHLSEIGAKNLTLSLKKASEDASNY